MDAQTRALSATAICGGSTAQRVRKMRRVRPCGQRRRRRPHEALLQRKRSSAECVERTSNGLCPSDRPFCHPGLDIGGERVSPADCDDTETCDSADLTCKPN